MKQIKLGDLVLFKTHPYVHKIDPIKISANAQLIPPILNVDEVIYSDIDRTNVLKVKGRFYNSISNKFESIWFNIDEVILFKSIEDVDEVFELFSKCTLKSSVDELKKLKAIHQVDNGLSKSSSSSTLNHLPPVFILLEEKDIEIRGNKKIKDVSNIGYRVKWFNPKTGSFSEDILPKNIMKKVSDTGDESRIVDAIENKYIYQYELLKPVLDRPNDLNIENTIIRMIDLRYNHFSIVIKFFDILFNKEFELTIDEARPILEKQSKLFSDYFFNKHPKLIMDNFVYPYEFQFKTRHLYTITYVNNFGEKKARCIVVLRILEPNLNEKNNDDGKMIEAFCLLRKEIRYFWTKRIVQMFESVFSF